RCHFPDEAPDMPHRTAVAPMIEAAPGGPKSAVLGVRRLSKTYVAGGRRLQASHDIDLDLWGGETLGLVGESGSGKSTLAKLLLGLASPDPGGVIEMDGEALPPRARRRSRPQLKALQIVFQNPGLAL